jgi:hypothetical protein
MRYKQKGQKRIEFPSAIFFFLSPLRGTVDFCRLLISFIAMDAHLLTQTGGIAVPH